MQKKKAIWHLPTKTSPHNPPGGAAPIEAVLGDGSLVMLCAQATSNSVARLYIEIKDTWHS